MNECYDGHAADGDETDRANAPSSQKVATQPLAHTEPPTSTTALSTSTTATNSSIMSTTSNKSVQCAQHH